MARATEMGRQPGWTQLNQYKNPANPDAHFRTTGPEVWRQTDGKITHFVAGLGTCGTITGTGRFLRSKNPGVKVFGVHPADGHDIPGVRTLRALKLTDFFLPKEYDGLTEVGNADAYAMNKRILQEECLIAGPSSAMALVGALRVVPDEPGAVCVVMFPDNAFKYISSYRKHLPELFPAGSGDAPPPAPPPPAADEIINGDQAAALVKDGAVMLDVRTPGEYSQGHIAEAQNVPLQDLQANSAKGLPADQSQTIVTMCAVGKRSLAALQILKARGYRKVRSVAGGMQAWLNEGRPLKIR
jgi:rhodanese-related sulfurtransferase